MSKGSPTEDLKARVRKVAELGKTHGVAFEDAAAIFPKVDREGFNKLLAAEGKGHDAVNAILTNWLELIKAKQQEKPKVLPTQKDLAPTLGLPKVDPLGSEELTKRMVNLTAVAKKLGGNLESIPVSAFRNGPVTFETMQALIAGDERRRALASKILEEWTAALRELKKGFEAQRGATGKQSAPVRPELTNGATWVALGLTEEEQNWHLEAHNKWRADYGMPPLKYDDRLAANAQEWACQLAVGSASKPRNLCMFQHHKDPRTPGLEGELGENLSQFASKGQAWGGKGLHQNRIESYGSEVANYDLINKEPKQTGGDYGHFTQMIWRSTKLLGCGYVAIQKADGWIVGIWVHRYHPAGNVVSRFAENT